MRDAISWKGPKISVVEEADASREVAEAYEYWRVESGRSEVPAILKSLSARPDFLKQAVDFCNTIQFSDGHLSRRHKEMIGTYASFLNHSPGSLDAYFPNTQGAGDRAMAALREGNLAGAHLTAAEHALMNYVELVTRAAYRTTREDIQKLRDAGWREEQIAEAVYIIALFAMFDRIANAFGVSAENQVTRG